MTKRKDDNIQVTAFDDDWLDKFLAGVAIVVCCVVMGFIVYSFAVI